MAAHAVEFVGGPLDGHLQTFEHPPERLPATTNIPVNPSLLRFIFTDGRLDEVCGGATSIALYELHDDAERLHYCHLRSVAEEELEFQSA